jgi:4-hydroxy-tetrahydrodipicolinate synthase
MVSLNAINNGVLMFKGSMVALVTPMLNSGQIDWSSLEKLVQWHLSAGTDALVILGTTGESATITRSERTSIITRVMAMVAGRIPVIVGTGTNCTALSIELTAEARQLGAAAALVVTPYYNKPTQAGLFAHYQAVAEAEIPLILYNVPSRTGVDLLPETVRQIAATIPSVVGLKDATGDISRLKQLQALDIDLDFYSGDDATALEFMQTGGVGVITVTGNVAPHAFAQMCALQRSGDNLSAEKINAALQPLYSALFIESNPIPTKWFLARDGHIATSALRLPLVELSVAAISQLSATLPNLNFIKETKCEV